MTYKIGDIFKNDSEYVKRAQFCNENGYYIKDLGNGTYQICEQEKPTEDELALAQSEQELSETEAQINDIKDRLLYAILLDDTETAEQLKSEYKELVNE